MQDGSRHALITVAWASELQERLVARIGADRTTVVPHARAELVSRALETADVAIISTNADRRFLEAPNLQWLHIDHAGIDAYAPRALLARLTVTSSAGRSAIGLAEEAFFLMQSVARRARLVERNRRWRIWDARSVASASLHGRRVLIIGGGSIATELASRCAAFGMPVTVVRRTPAPPGPHVVRALARPSPAQLTACCAEADVLVLAASLNDRSHHMIGADQLDALGPSGIVVNVARGALIDEPAMIDALRAGRLAGAGLDVTDPEPPSPFSPLWRLPNVVITPHAPPRAADRDERSLAIIDEVWSQLRAGQPVARAFQPDEDAYSYAPRRRAAVDRIAGAVWRRSARRLR